MTASYVEASSGASLTLVAYIATCLATLRAASRDGPSNSGIWLCIFTLFGLLTINKYFDLQTRFADFMRYEAEIYGWYGNRRLFQHILFISSVALFLLTTFWIIPLIKRRGYALSIAIFSSFFLTLYICIRATSLHGIDSFLGSQFLTIRINDFLERFGIVVTGIAALTMRRPMHADRR